MGLQEKMQVSVADLPSFLLWFPGICRVNHLVDDGSVNGVVVMLGND